MCKTMKTSHWSMRSSSRRIWSTTTTAKLDPTTAKAGLTTTCGKKAMTGLEATTAKLEATVKTEHGGGPEHGRRRSEQDNEDLCLTRRRWKKLGCT
ncbi:hypothetical protein Bca4012_050589 [Brassica carinata]|uniref:Uncharacterized protein n=1 Tax=Brassica carinata TaxID=52824 RepID=A0A8X7R8N7_BRACI|nr:hypothetical protein Bca52824_053283 [Brassica carinata]